MLACLEIGVYLRPPYRDGFEWVTALLMSDQTPEATKLQRAENFLRGQIVVLEAEQKRNELDRQRVEAERARIDLELAKTRNALAELMCVDDAAASTIQLSPRDQEHETFEAEAPKKGDFAGLELTDAIYQYLLLQTQMRSIKEIWKALERAGFKVVSGHPTRAVGEALRKRAHRRNDVFKAGSRWGATKNFTNNYIRRITKRHAGMGGHSPEEHGAATSAGIEKRRAAGLRVGPPRKLDAAMVVRIKELRARGMNITATCKAVGISRALFNIYRNRMRIWKEGTLWPPPEPTREEVALAELEEVQSQPSRLRVVR